MPPHVLRHGCVSAGSALSQSTRKIFPVCHNCGLPGYRCGRAIPRCVGALQIQFEFRTCLSLLAARCARVFETHSPEEPEGMERRKAHPTGGHSLARAARVSADTRTPYGAPSRRSPSAPGRAFVRAFRPGSSASSSRGFVVTPSGAPAPPGCEVTSPARRRRTSLHLRHVSGGDYLPLDWCGLDRIIPSLDRAASRGVRFFDCKRGLRMAEKLARCRSWSRASNNPPHGEFA